MSDAREIQEVFARYVRSTDKRDGAEQGTLFTDDAVIQIFSKIGPKTYEPVGDPLIGGQAVEFAVKNYMAPHPEGGSSHHTTSDTIVNVDGDTAHYNAQFIVFEVRSPVPGTPVTRPGAQGTVTPIESGYYDTDLRKIDGVWRIVRHHVLMDVPMVIPTA